MFVHFLRFFLPVSSSSCGFFLAFESNKAFTFLLIVSRETNSSSLLLSLSTREHQCGNNYTHTAQKDNCLPNSVECDVVLGIATLVLLVGTKSDLLKLIS